MADTQDETPMTERDLLMVIKTKVETFIDGQKDHETRIRRLERIVWLAMGFAAAGGGVAGGLVTSMLNGHAN